MKSQHALPKNTAQALCWHHFPFPTTLERQTPSRTSRWCYQQHFCLTPVPQGPERNNAANFSRTANGNLHFSKVQESHWCMAPWLLQPLRESPPCDTAMMSMEQEQVNEDGKSCSTLSFLGPRAFTKINSTPVLQSLCAFLTFLLSLEREKTTPVTRAFLLWALVKSLIQNTIKDADQQHRSTF